MKTIFVMAAVLLLTISCTRTVYVKVPLTVPNLQKMPSKPSNQEIECLSLETKLKIGERELIYRNNQKRLIKRILLK